MGRLKGPMPPAPAGDEPWPILNAVLFGSHEVGGYHVAPRPEVLPLRWPEVFGRDAPRTLEIGFNRGRFLADLAARRPAQDHVGIEVRRRYAWHVAHRLAAEGGPRNAAVIWGDARLLVPALFGPGELEDVFINFPDPWWKRRHAKRRLVDPEMATHLATVLRPGGSVWVKTDAAVIADAITRVLADEPRFTGPISFGEADLPPSYRERRCMAQGLPITRFRFERK